MLRLILLAIATAGLLAFIFPGRSRQQVAAYTVVNQKLAAFRCAPDYNPFTDGNSISPLSGWGNYQWKIATANDSAQFYFNQGINMYYAFHIIEARASFARVIEFDPNAAMGWWALALSFGPNINDFGYSAPPDALPAAQKAKALMQNCTAREKALIEAMAIRYSPDTSLSRDTLNKMYAAAMKRAYTAFPKDSDIAALYADALMLLHPWDLYENYKPKPWTPEIVAVLEAALKANPLNPGANHYYIHAVEASDNPARALPSADRLPDLMPDVSHLVHMPSHIYIRTGNYKKGAALNEAAVRGYQKYLQAFPAVAENAALYSIHNLHMQANCDQMAGNYERAKVSSIKAYQSVPEMYLGIPGPLGHFIQYVYSTPLFTMVRFGKWEEILKSEVPDSLSYAKILHHFARGIAFARTGQSTHATYELTKLRIKMNEDASLKEPFTPFNSAYNTSRIAEVILAGVIAEEAGRFNDAIEYFEKGVSFEDALVYNEPRDWLLPVRHYLGQALLKAGKYGRAEFIFGEDLRINPNNGWALTGLYQAHVKQNHKAAADKTLAALTKAFAEKDADIKSSVY